MFNNLVLILKQPSLRFDINRSEIVKECFWRFWISLIHQNILERKVGMKEALLVQFSQTLGNRSCNFQR